MNSNWVKYLFGAYRTVNVGSSLFSEKTPRKASDFKEQCERVHERIRKTGIFEKNIFPQWFPVQ